MNTPGAEEAGDLEILLEYLRSSRGFDFTGYKRPTLERRIKRRMQAIGVGDYHSYLDRLQVDTGEFVELFNFILINVTSFFRDEEVWAYLRERVLPSLLESKGPQEEIRIWCAGCSSGEEAYSVAMAFGEIVGREKLTPRVKIYATDLDEQALALARQGTFGPKQMESVPEALRQSYFDEVGGQFVFNKALRRCIIFGRHDLLQDAPISKIDLLVCRNTLMYFNSDAQTKIISKFYFGLAEGGCLVLGKAEMMFGYHGVFVPIDLKKRIFSKGSRSEAGQKLVLFAQGGAGQEVGLPSSQDRTRELAFESGSVAQIIVNGGGTLVSANARARGLFSLDRADIGVPLADLELSHRPAELGALVEKAQSGRRRIRLAGVRWQEPNGTEIFLDIDIVPLHESENNALGAVVQFFDVSREKALRDELEQSNSELETAIEELQSTNEELETTNEELQSTNEELETTNEELQSTNEELETTNEELQSTNQELETTNNDLRRTGTELNRLNTLLETMMDSVRSGVVVLDSGLRVQAWNKNCYEQWGLTLDDVRGEPLLSLDIGLSVEEVGSLALQSLAANAPGEIVVEGLNRRGKTIRCRVLAAPMDPVGGAPQSVILLIEQVPKEP